MYVYKFDRRYATLSGTNDIPTTWIVWWKERCQRIQVRKFWQLKQKINNNNVYLYSAQTRVISF